MKRDTASRYLRSSANIHGWFQPGAAYLFAMLDEIQKANGIRGNLFEIGVHHGKSTIVLGGMVDPASETLGVCDLFGEQAANVSRSGHGDYQVFLRNFAAVFAKHPFLRVFRKASMDLTPEETTTKCRFFHVDGGHSPVETFTDLQTASRALIIGGLIVIDDLFNCAWPGVMEGFFRFMVHHEGEFQPLAIGFNKMVLVRPDDHGMYMSWLGDPDRCWEFLPKEPYEHKTMEFFAKDAAVLYIPSYKGSEQVGLIHALHRKLVGLKNRVTGRTASFLDYK